MLFYRNCTRVNARAHMHRRALGGPYKAQCSMVPVQLAILLGFACILSTHIASIQCQYVAQTADHTQRQYGNEHATTLCTATDNPTPYTQGICECGVETGVANDTARYQVTCTKRYLNNARFAAAGVPARAELLLLASNEFTAVPTINSSKLSVLDLSTNRITVVQNRSFELLTALIELNLEHNQIDLIELNAFDGLTELKRLDLAHNRLKSLYANIFRPLRTLEALILSRNHQLNETLHEQPLFTSLGVTATLSRLELNDVSLQTLDLQNGTGLIELYLRYNYLSTAPTNLPINVQLLDLSGNQFGQIDQHFLPAENSLRELHLQQVLTLTAIDRYAFHNLTHLRVLNMDGCRNLQSFHPLAFNRLPLTGSANEPTDFAATSLERINLRNAMLERFNLGEAGSDLHWEQIDLYGNPIICDCHSKWLRNIKFDTYARCAQPQALQNRSLRKLPRNSFVCDFWPKLVHVFMHSVLVLCIVVLGAVPIWLLIVLIKPSRRVKLQRIGASSPYAPITIDTSRAEDYY